MTLAAPTDEVTLSTAGPGRDDVAHPTLPLLESTREAAELLRAFAARRLPHSFVLSEALGRAGLCHSPP